MTPRELDRLGIDERRLMEQALRDGVRDDPPEEGEVYLALRLAAINAGIWERENRIRELKRRGDGNDTETFCKTVARLCFETLQLNDWRAEIIGEEKLR